MNGFASFVQVLLGVFALLPSPVAAPYASDLCVKMQGARLVCRERGLSSSPVGLLKQLPPSNCAAAKLSRLFYQSTVCELFTNRYGLCFKVY